MTVPSLYDWVGGIAALERLTAAFYDKVRADDVLGPVFARMSPDHPAHVAAFLAEVMGGPKLYSERHGGHPEMIRHHLSRNLSEAQRRRWINLLLDTYTELGLPDDPEFASVLVGYLEWGTRMAVLNSRPGATPALDEPMPRWGWGEVGGPYQGKQG
ncbi:group II truncated hemoglobin [Devosia nitrariae]|uniref:Globin n=1 Tax=Devosia nitrariae TaxID=2071872 RepID=A0ABQ5VYT3_9HYPH|nr:group II truncated hemoglobin [Devosia nitrariae]GLQ52970.1 globin [Devosia nitrariae]